MKQLEMEIKEYAPAESPLDSETVRELDEIVKQQENCQDKVRHTFEDPEVAEDGCPTCGWGAK